MRVKICGVNDAAAWDAAAEAGADWIGFNFFPASPRFVTAGQAAELSARSPGGPPNGPLLVGLFVDPSGHDLAAVLNHLRLDAIQLYGPAPDPASLRAGFGVDVWRAVGIDGAADLPRDAAGADALVIEAKAPPGATRPGGNARAFDWRALAGWVAPAPWLLAGGLTAETVAGAIRATGARAVDVSSGVERAPGRKDPSLIRRFVAAARQV